MAKKIKKMNKFASDLENAVFYINRACERIPSYDEVDNGKDVSSKHLLCVSLLQIASKAVANVQIHLKAYTHRVPKCGCGKNEGCDECGKMS